MAQVPADDKRLLEPYAYIHTLPGKNVRGMLVEAFQLWLQTPAEKVEAIKAIVDELHNASLLIDDIEDNSELRRGKPVAHAIFGVPATINCANYVFFLSLQRCAALQNESAMKIYIDEMLRLHQGQGLDIYWRDQGVCPTEEEYRTMVENKTGGLFRLAVGLMQAFSSNTTDFVPLLNKLAVYFQIRDDYINLVDGDYMENKSFCEDLTEGKFSFPLIIAIRANQEDTRLINILKQRTQNVELKKYAVEYMKEVGAFTRTRTVLDELVEQIHAEIKTLGGNPLLQNIVETLHAKLP